MGCDMFEFIINKVFSKESPENSFVTVEITKPPTPKELFDKAVSKVVQDTLRDSLDVQLTEMCYTSVEVSQTKRAIAEFGSYHGTSKMTEIKTKYPSVVWGCHGSSPHSSTYVIKLTFSYQKFLDKLLSGV